MNIVSPPITLCFQVPIRQHLPSDLCKRLACLSQPITQSLQVSKNDEVCIKKQRTLHLKQGFVFKMMHFAANTFLFIVTVTGVIGGDYTM